MQENKFKIGDKVRLTMDYHYINEDDTGVKINEGAEGVIKDFNLIGPNPHYDIGLDVYVPESFLELVNTLLGIGDMIRFIGTAPAFRHTTWEILDIETEFNRLRYKVSEEPNIWFDQDEIEVVWYTAKHIAPKALRYNTGKPQFSYLFTFPNAMQYLLFNAKDFKGYAKNDFDVLDVVSRFQNKELGNDNLSMVAMHLLWKLDHTLNKRTLEYNAKVKNLAELIVNFYPAFSEVVQVCTNGALKYARNNWQKGLPFIGVIDSFTRHYLKWLQGKQRDDLDDYWKDRWNNEENFKDMWKGNYAAFEAQIRTHHLSHCIWNLMCILEYTVIVPDMDDR